MFAGGRADLQEHRRAKIRHSFRTYAAAAPLEVGITETIEAPMA